jgi:FkbM family methyltransferase
MYNLSAISNIEFYKKGLWDSVTSLKFDNTNGGANSINTNGLEIIETVTIDSSINSKIDFIKLDIEGAEIQAIKGAQRVIHNFKPKLAVCVYHNQKDFIEIPSLILKINPDYKLYLRHYSQGIFETVMYFV